MFRRFLKDLIFFNAQSTAATSSLKEDVTDFRNAVMSFASTGHAAATVKIQGSIGQVPPDFSAAQSDSNAWEYLQAVDLNTGDPVDGSTGIVFTAENDVRLYEVNVNAVDWLSVTATTLSSGAVTVKATVTTNL